MRLSKILLWLLLALPAALMLHGIITDSAPPMDLLHPSGEMSIRLMILAMLPGPLADFFGYNRFLQGWIGIRRNLGVAAAGYGVLHLIFYTLDMGTLAAILDELTLPAIWTGWLAIAFLLAAASVSFDAAMRSLGRRTWKRIQQGVYAAFLLSLIHWFLLDRQAGPAVVHLAPLMIAWMLRGLAQVRRRVQEG